MSSSGGPSSREWPGSARSFPERIGTLTNVSWECQTILPNQTANILFKIERDVEMDISDALRLTLTYCSIADRKTRGLVHPSRS